MVFNPLELDEVKFLILIYLKICIRLELDELVFQLIDLIIPLNFLF
jgi:hypothetical protein